MAITTMTLLLVKNGRWINIVPGNLYKIAKSVAESDPKSMNVVLPMLEAAFSERIVDFHSVV